jgi:hypothetical protein
MSKDSIKNETISKIIDRLLSIRGASEFFVPCNIFKNKVRDDKFISIGVLALG